MPRRESRIVEGSSRGIHRSQLEPLVEGGATLQEMADSLGVGVDKVRYWLAKHGLRTRNRVGRRPNVSGNPLPVAVRVCRRHGETEHVRDPRGYYKCKRCRAEAVARRRRRVKELLVQEAGGRCVLCGYDRCLSALGFHHVDPSTKSFGIAHRGVTRAIAEVRREIKKCILCARTATPKSRPGAPSCR